MAISLKDLVIELGTRILRKPDRIIGEIDEDEVVTITIIKDDIISGKRIHGFIKAEQYFTNLKPTIHLWGEIVFPSNYTDGKLWLHIYIRDNSLLSDKLRINRIYKLTNLFYYSLQWSDSVIF